MTLSTGLDPSPCAALGGQGRRCVCSFQAPRHEGTGQKTNTTRRTNKTDQSKRNNGGNKTTEAGVVPGTADDGDEPEEEDAAEVLDGRMKVDMTDRASPERLAC